MVAVGTGLAPLGGRFPPDGVVAVGTGLAPLGGRFSPDGVVAVGTGLAPLGGRSFFLSFLSLIPKVSIQSEGI